MHSREAMERTIKCWIELSENVGSAYSKGLIQEFLKGGLQGLSRAPAPNPSEYTAHQAFSADYAVYTFLRKLEVSDDAHALEQLAFASFVTSEVRNKERNTLLYQGLTESNVEGIISDARRKIGRILGKFSWTEFHYGCGWGPGSTTTLHSDSSTLDNKIAEPHMSVTPRAAKLMAAVIGYSPLWCRARGINSSGPCTLLPSEFLMTDCTKLSTVPKDVTKRRTIDPQPTANSFLQKGVGKMIRKRLAREGIDLNSQSRNQLLASLAHILGLATVDLKDASNSLVTALVDLLLPADWLAVCHLLRVTHTEVNGVRHKLELFSGMGNGFTFELESLIFYALCWAIVRDEGQDLSSPIAVYGDDIIIASRHYHRLAQVFPLLGLTVNGDKSFSEGPFYESCGRHYFNGHEVTPIYQKKLLEECSDLIRCANRVIRWAHRVGSGFYLANVALECYLYLAVELIVLHELSEDRRLSYAKGYWGKSRKRRRNLPRQPFGVEGDRGLIDIDYLPPPGKLSLTGYGSISKKRPGKADALLVEVLREKSEPHYHPDGTYISVRPYGLGAYLASGLPRPFVSVRTPPSKGMVTLRGRDRVTWTCGYAWHTPTYLEWMPS